MKSDLELMREIISEDIKIMRALVQEDIVPIMKYRAQLEKEAFNKAYKELKELEKEV